MNNGFLQTITIKINGFLQTITIEITAEMLNSRVSNLISCGMKKVVIQMTF